MVMGPGQNGKHTSQVHRIRNSRDQRDWGGEFVKLMKTDDGKIAITRAPTYRPQTRKWE